ncbi:GNAT family N-acetyltransferase [Rhodococcus sp. HNM0569]|uniref:GNAT family N-acetyltransferase n=1 Tax=Rhodococcus sp. HNM0569 TaxID=2716340 RepID=UPI00146F6AC3|nr:GNAT family N-acetyltransferase [Rhodococcus sp. HNM0569]NLU84204.1 GNAT family N-acetyltransferase [Rhodococcus sp. HNM0569]
MTTGDTTTNRGGDITVRSATGSDLPAIASVLGRAFHRDDPVGEYLFPDESVRDRRQPKMILTMARRRHLPQGTATVATVDGRIEGVLLWHGPDHTRTPWHSLIGGPELMRDMGTRVAAGIRVDAALARTVPGVPHILAVYLGASPENHRRGVGTALFQDLVDRADTLGVPVCGLCKDSNVPFYERFDGHLIGTTTLGRRGPRVNVMLRVPRR